MSDFRCTVGLARRYIILRMLRKIGVSKININSDMRYAFRTTLEKTLRENPNEYAIVKLMPPVYAAVQEVVESKIKAFNSVRKAVV